ncbi:hypothetical protein GCM10011297_23090 [Bacterioplanes sanyensis]|uniref:hypothetical protein n=1 Tax=Bacterioplanes sanyensis TaxID=1249553 RepID=UPI001673E4E6|nr:hypothetical protein [Bacterioplanes sanyensis]GGY49528.1 hypothetical protein GCM10011297_23090 [Bacterioplanes sanyensis]
MKNLKDKEIKMISVLFIEKSNLVLLLSGAPMIIAMVWQPIVISATKFFLIFIASATYVAATYISITQKKDITYLSWFVSLPLVVYCSAESVNNLDWSEMEKNANWLTYLSAYFFIIAVSYRILILLFPLAERK